MKLLNSLFKILSNQNNESLALLNTSPMISKHDKFLVRHYSVLLEKNCYWSFI